MKLRQRLLFCIFIALSCSSAFAQQAITSATVHGLVVDSSGAAVPSTTVTITNLDRNQGSSTQTDDRGRFQFLYLPVGSYEIKAEHSGFGPSTAKMTLSLGQALDLSMKLPVAGLASQVDVTGATTMVETSRTQLAETVTPAEIQALPLNGRNYLDLALLVPGVSKTNTGNNERFAETSAVPGTGISIAGQRNLANGFVVDGLSANDDAADLPGTFFSQEVIREFQVVSSGGIAEFGRASSGVVNIVTQSGSNDWHGGTYGFLRNQRLDGRNAFATRRSPFTQAQYGASIGGPVVKDRAFLFSNFEQERLHRSGLITISPANATAINSVLDQLGYAPPRITTGEYPTGDVRTSFFAKFDNSFNARNRYSTRYSLYDLDSPNARNVGALSAVSRGTRVATRDQTIAFSDLFMKSPTSVNEFRFQATRSRLSAPGNDLLGPAVSISGVASFGASTSSPTARDITLLEFADNFSIQKGSHLLKAGVDGLYNRVNIVFPATLYGTYSFSSMANFLAGNYSTFGQAFGKTGWFQTNPNLGWFIQDEWKPRRDLTINAGVRQDVEWLADNIETRSRNFSPRVGLAYAPGDRKTVVRAGFGQYGDRIPLRAVANALRGAGTDYRSVSLQRTQVGAPVFPNKLAAFPVGTLFNLSTIDSKIRNSYGLQANVEIEREVTRGTSISVAYLRMRGVHIIMQRNLNVPTLTAAQDPVNLGRPNPNFGNISQYSGQGDSYYNGMTVSVQHRASRWGTARVSYTLSKSIDNTGNAFFSAPQNNFNLRDDRGLSDNDQRHHLTVSGELKAPYGIRMSPIFTVASPYPFNVVTGGQTLQSTTARVAGTGRNTGVGFTSASLDLRLSRAFELVDGYRMEFIAESFNVTNRTNLQFPNNTFGTGTTPVSTFGKATAAGDPRQIQFGMKLSF